MVIFAIGMILDQLPDPKVAGVIPAESEDLELGELGDEGYRKKLNDERIERHRR